MNMARWATGFCETNGINVHYHRTGGDKPVIILLHGLMLNGASGTPLARALEAEYDVIMPDARGHGHSTACEKGYTYDNLAADVIGLMNGLKLEKPVLIGHSMGGLTAAMIASQHSERLKGVILADPAFMLPDRQKEVSDSDVIKQHRSILSRSKEEFLDRMRRRSDRSLEVIELFVEARFQTKLEALQILNPPMPDYRPLVEAIKIPSLLVIGDRDSVVSLEVALELANLNAYLEVVQIANAGHALMFDQPERFIEIVKTFLSKVNFN